MDSSEKIASKPSHRYSLFRMLPYWYIAAKSTALRRKPLAIRIWDTPLVLFRDAQGQAHALLDRCSHRNVPLSQGKCLENHIQCPYHGWEFNGQGQCKKIPALCGEAERSNRQVPSFPVCEKQGFIWVFTDHSQTPNHQPYDFPGVDQAGYTTITYQADFEGSLHATAENVLDVPHTAFLHKGLFRGGKPNKIQTVVRRYKDQAECEYIGEPRPSGIMGKIIAPGGGEVKHYDRFLLPSIAQVEYQLGSIQIIASSQLTPISDYVTRMHAVVTVKFNRFLLWFLRPLVTYFALRVVKQDIEILKLQTQAVQEFGGEKYVFTDIDLLGPAIMRLMKKASTEAIAISETEQSSPESTTEGHLLA